MSVEKMLHIIHVFYGIPLDWDELKSILPKMGFSESFAFENSPMSLASQINDKLSTVEEFDTGLLHFHCDESGIIPIRSPDARYAFVSSLSFFKNYPHLTKGVLYEDGMLTAEELIPDDESLNQLDMLKSHLGLLGESQMIVSVSWIN